MKSHKLEPYLEPLRYDFNLSTPSYQGQYNNFRISISPKSNLAIYFYLYLFINKSKTPRKNKKNNFTKSEDLSLERRLEKGRKNYFYGY